MLETNPSRDQTEHHEHPRTTAIHPHPRRTGLSRRARHELADRRWRCAGGGGFTAAGGHGGLPDHGRVDGRHDGTDRRNQPPVGHRREVRRDLGHLLLRRATRAAAIGRGIAPRADSRWLYQCHGPGGNARSGGPHHGDQLRRNLVDQRQRCLHLQRPGPRRPDDHLRRLGPRWRRCRLDGRSDERLLDHELHAARL